MFARKFRLPASIKITHSPFFQTDFFSLKIAPNSLVHNRYGFVVSKRIDTRAVVRNRVKRRLRACVEALHEKIAPGNDLLFVIKKNAVTATTESLQAEVMAVFKKSNLL